MVYMTPDPDPDPDPDPGPNTGYTMVYMTPISFIKDPVTLKSHGSPCPALPWDGMGSGDLPASVSVPMHNHPKIINDAKALRLTSHPSLR